MFESLNQAGSPFLTWVLSPCTILSVCLHELDVLSSLFHICYDWLAFVTFITTIAAATEYGTQGEMFFAHGDTLHHPIREASLRIFSYDDSRCTEHRNQYAILSKFTLFFPASLTLLVVMMISRIVDDDRDSRGVVISTVSVPDGGCCVHLMMQINISFCEGCLSSMLCVSLQRMINMMATVDDKSYSYCQSIQSSSLIIIKSALIMQLGCVELELTELLNSAHLVIENQSTPSR